MSKNLPTCLVSGGNTSHDTPANGRRLGTDPLRLRDRLSGEPRMGASSLLPGTRPEAVSLDNLNPLRIFLPSLPVPGAVADGPFFMMKALVHRHASTKVSAAA